MKRTALDQTVLKVSGLHKNFDGVDVLNGVSFSINRGEVVALLGDNGAGKSTLVNCLAGRIQPNKGTIEINEQALLLNSPSASEQAGLAIVHQDLALVNELSVIENLFLNREILHSNKFLRFFGWLDKSAMAKKAQKLLQRLGTYLPDLNAPVATLSGGQKQVIAIIRAVHAGADIIVMDEPTSALGAEQYEFLMSLIRLLSSQGIAIMLISHNLHQVSMLCDRAVVLFQGYSVADVALNEVDQAQLLAYMNGAVLEMAQAS
ncbi:ATP-binding cassette domain-containing protein [Pseudoalteromonas obscura]|uniref:ATP-binding cassette domain-containing protein n=1 Tax=Pseudoalteromonas obscura TaxID=3048491 RepID=A0ABT7EKS1_9GAMM|nr:ATP-binding cassette domain-containing protein [Pseudoalteromonas sp. P94(2023)]MDK2595654.1 ATP-binding cassette domain-containing protein [Pseudoalteromonas sp. P94(2023)]